MIVDSALAAALDRVAARAADVQRAFVPGARAENRDVAAEGEGPRFTLDRLSCAPPGGTYVMTVDARGRTGYSQDGSFLIAGGKLVDARGLAVLGRAYEGAPLGELRVDPVDAALGRADDPRIEADGRLTYRRAIVDPRTQQHGFATVVFGRIALARFPAGTQLDSEGARSFAPEGVAPHVGMPADGTFAPVSPMHRARSGVSLDDSLAKLKDAYVAFDALAAARAAADRLGKTAMDVVK